MLSIPVVGRATQTVRVFAERSPSAGVMDCFHLNPKTHALLIDCVEGLRETAIPSGKNRILSELKTAGLVRYSWRMRRWELTDTGLVVVDVLAILLEGKKH